MARKDKADAEAEATAEEDQTAPVDEEEPFVSDEEMVDFTPDTEFDLEDEYKPEPLVPNGNFRGNVTGVAFDPQQNCIAWKVTLDGNGGLMSDGETSIDGWAGYKRVWLPKVGDDNVMTKDGRQTKRQSKINMMKRFAEDMRVNMNSPKLIATAIANQDWVGIPVIVAMGMGEFEGRVRNEIGRLKQAEAAPIEE